MAAPGPGRGRPGRAYLWYLEVGGDALARALSLLGSREHYPLVFHCAAGKDRTGVLAALVLDILGVDREVIVADYVVTAERLQLILERWKAEPGFTERMAKVPPSRFSVEAPTMEGFLDGVRSRWGGARAWAVGAGVPEATLDRMVGLLLEPAD